MLYGIPELEEKRVLPVRIEGGLQDLDVLQGMLDVNLQSCARASAVEEQERGRSCTLQH